MQRFPQHRRARQVENEILRVTVLQEGGHLAEILHKPTGLNPLWTPPWPTIEPSAFDPRKHAGYGTDAEARLLAGIMGHNVCVDLFGGPSPEEAAAGLTVHGEASVASYEFDGGGTHITARCAMPIAQLQFERTVTLDGDTVRIQESVENLSACDRPIAWTQHVTLGPPFLAPGLTQFDIPGTRSKVYEDEFGDYMQTGAAFDWPHVPCRDGRSLDLRIQNPAPVSAGYTAHLMDPTRDTAYFHAYSPAHGLLFGYEWTRADFPWLGIWEENHFRQQAPWNGRTLARGFEFGVSPMPETRRRMITRGSLFGVPSYRWLPARSRRSVQYTAFARAADPLYTA